jgi:16S rRNA processing protein RimM
VHVTPLWPDLVTVGRIARPHGIRGQVVIAPETDFVLERFAVGAIVLMERAGRVVELRVTASRMHDGRAIVAFEGIETMNDAEVLRGAELRVPHDALPDLPAGSFWVHDLVGCRVTTVAGLAVGEVRRVEFGGATPLLVVSRDAPGDQEDAEVKTGEVLIPLVDAMCPRVDVKAREVIVDPPEGLLDVNAPRSGR